MTDFQRRRFTTTEYHRMLEGGILRDGERIELLAGEIYEAASKGSRHAACVSRLAKLFERHLGERLIVRVQSPIELSDSSEPEPDLSLVAWRPDHYAAAHPRPGQVLLLIEVSDTTYGLDRHFKLPLYARAGIPEVWIVRLESDRIESWLDGDGTTYRTLERHRRAGTLAPRLFPEIGLAVDEILP